VFHLLPCSAFQVTLLGAGHSASIRCTILSAKITASAIMTFRAGLGRVRDPRRKARICAWRRFPPNLIRRLAETVPSRNLRRNPRIAMETAEKLFSAADQAPAYGR